MKGAWRIRQGRASRVLRGVRACAELTAAPSEWRLRADLPRPMVFCPAAHCLETGTGVAVVRHAQPALLVTLGAVQGQPARQVRGIGRAGLGGRGMDGRFVGFQRGRGALFVPGFPAIPFGTARFHWLAASIGELDAAVDLAFEQRTGTGGLANLQTEKHHEETSHVHSCPLSVYGLTAGVILTRLTHSSSAESHDSDEVSCPSSRRHAEMALPQPEQRRRERGNGDDRNARDARLWSPPLAFRVFNLRAASRHGACRSRCSSRPGRWEYGIPVDDLITRNPHLRAEAGRMAQWAGPYGDDGKGLDTGFHQVQNAQMSRNGSRPPGRPGVLACYCCRT